MDGESYHDSLFLEIEIIFFWRIGLRGRAAAAPRGGLPPSSRDGRAGRRHHGGLRLARSDAAEAPFFKKRFGVSMREWRNSSAKAGALARAAFTAREGA